MKRFAQGLALVLASTTLGLAAPKTDAPPAVSKAGKAAKSGRADKAARVHKAPAKAKAPPAGVKEGVKEGPGEDAKTGDITIKGKAGSVTHVSYGQSVKPEANASSGKPAGQ
jgi:hypothetical protein